MRHLAALCLPLAICAAADPAPERAADPVVVVRPESVTLNISQYFDEAGKVRNSSADLRIELALKPPAGCQLLACRGVQLASATTDSGEALRPRQRGMEMGQESFNSHERQSGDYDISLALSAPLKAQTITALTGTITLAVATGEATVSELKPLKDFLGKALLLEGMDLPVTVAREGGRFTIRGPREAFERIDTVSGQRADGTAIEINGWGGGSNGDDYYRQYHADVPDAGSLSIKLLPAAREIQVPFSLGPIPLQPAPATAAGEAVRVPAAKPKAKPAPESKPPRVAPEPGSGDSGF